MGLFGLGIPELAIIAGVATLLFGEAFKLSVSSVLVSGSSPISIHQQSLTLLAV